jgi:lipopolysaccharide biosynthesis glycosyltransferase
MTSNQPVRVFIGSGEASVLERKTLIHSIRKHTQRPLDIYVFNGTHNAIEHNDEPPVLADMSLNVKYRNYTEFSNYRWLIPSICNHQGRAIFLDSDMVCLSDIGEFFDADMQGCDMLAKAEAYKGDATWGMSAVLFDCSRCRFDLEGIFAEVDAGKFTNTEFHQMAPNFLKHHPFKLGKIDPHWNSFDHLDSATKLIHYTNLGTQPWKFPGHVHEKLWFQYFEEAKKAGAVAQPDIAKALSRAYVRRDIQKPVQTTQPTDQASTIPSTTKLKFKEVKKRVRGWLGIQKKAA